MALVDETVDRFGGIDVLVNNAADTSGGTPSILDLDRAEWMAQFDANLHGPFSLMQAVLPSLRDAGGGVIVNMTSAAADLTPVLAADPDGPIRIGNGSRTVPARRPSTGSAT